MNYLNSNNRLGGILMYHSISDSSDLELDVSLEIFERQINYLIANYKIVDLKHMIDLLNNKKSTCASTSFCITFDDGYSDFYYNVFPLLLKYNIPCVLYICPSFVIGGNDFSIFSEKYRAYSAKYKPLSIAQISELHKSGLVTLAAHSYSHAEFPYLNDCEIADEILSSDRFFSDNFSIRPSHFAYPRGIWSFRAERLLSKRYDSVSLASGGFLKANASKYRLPRIAVKKSDGFLGFVNKLRSNFIVSEQIRTFKNFRLIF